MQPAAKFIIDTFHDALAISEHTKAYDEFMERFEVNKETLVSGKLADIVCELYDDVLYKEDNKAAVIAFNSLTAMADTINAVASEKKYYATLFIEAGLAELDHYDNEYLKIKY